MSRNNPEMNKFWQAWGKVWWNTTSVLAWIGGVWDNLPDLEKEKFESDTIRIVTTI